MLGLCYAIWAGAVFLLPEISLLASVIGAGVAIALHSSLQHEAIHGHPTRFAAVNAALVFPALALIVPYGRFRDDHLEHHRDERLTDPYDDPETNYLDPQIWARFSAPVRWLWRANNTLLGRMVIGVPLGYGLWIASDIGRMRHGARAVISGWLWHLPAVALVIWALAHASMPAWAYGVSVWIGLGLLKIRTFLEHVAHERCRCRSVIIEDRGPLALLFLNNNYHALHHAHPKLAWYKIPSHYRARRDYYLRRNDGYSFRSYAEVMRRYFLKTKDPVAHPLYDPRR